MQNFPSPTVGAFGGQSFNWGSSNETQLGAKEEGRNNNFTFHAPNTSRVSHLYYCKITIGFVHGQTSSK